MPPAFELNSRAQSKPRRNSCGPKYYCSFEGCELIFTRLDHLDRHEYHHTGIKKHACSYSGCDKVYSILTHLKRHVRSTHERAGLGPLAKTVKCEIEGCEKMFTTTCHMQRHIREVHENAKVYYCPECQERFTQKLKMRRHIIQKHTGEYPYECDRCHKGFYQQWHFERHVTAANCKVYHCPDCEQEFDKWTLYLKHCRDQQHGRKYYKCEHCDRMYGKPSELKRHVAVKHLDDDEHRITFHCRIEGCERSYTYERNLRQHMKIAHDGLKFKCEELDCTKEFSSAQNLAKHRERDHSELGKAKTKPQRVKKGEERKKRKDAGQSRLSILSQLCGLAVDRELDKLLRERNEDALAKVADSLAQDGDSEMETDDELAYSEQEEEAVSVEALMDIALQD